MEKLEAIELAALKLLQQNFPEAKGIIKNEYLFHRVAARRRTYSDRQKLGAVPWFGKNVRPRDNVCVTKHGLKIPVEAENYEAFVSKMRASEKEFRQAFL